MDPPVVRMHYPAMPEKYETPHRDVLKLLTGHFREVPGYRAYRSRGVGDWLLVLTLSGQGRFGHGGGELVTNRGDWVLLAPGTPHDYAVGRGAGHWELLWAHFRPRSEWYELLRWPPIAGGLMLLAPQDEGGELEAQFQHVHQLQFSGQRRADALAMNAMESLLLKCDMYIPTEQTRLDPRVREAMNFLEGQMSRSLSVQDVASAVGLSPSRLSHLFREETGRSVLNHLEDLRIGRASDLLRRTGFPVKQVAAEVGFESPFYFSRRFAKAIGQSPLAYRRQSAQRNGNREE